MENKISEYCNIFLKNILDDKDKKNKDIQELLLKICNMISKKDKKCLSNKNNQQSENLDHLIELLKHKIGFMKIKLEIEKCDKNEINDMIIDIINNKNKQRIINEKEIIKFKNNIIDADKSLNRLNILKHKENK